MTVLINLKQDMDVQEYIRNYQLAEKREAIFLLVWGLVSIVVSVVLYLVLDDLFSKFFAYPFAGLGAGMLVEAFFYFIAKIKQKLLFDDDILESEKNRAMGEIKKLDLRRNLDTVLLILGFALFILGGVVTTQTVSAGIGLGLLIQSTVLLVKDSWALWRARLYVVELEGEP
jgi:uncharacterized membrane protein